MKLNPRTFLGTRKKKVTLFKVPWILWKPKDKDSFLGKRNKELRNWGLAGLLSWLEGHPVHQKVAVSIPDKGVFFSYFSLCLSLFFTAPHPASSLKSVNNPVRIFFLSIEKLRYRDWVMTLWAIYPVIPKPQSSAIYNHINQQISLYLKQFFWEGSTVSSQKVERGNFSLATDSILIVSLIFHCWNSKGT